MESCCEGKPLRERSSRITGVDPDDALHGSLAFAVSHPRRSLRSRLAMRGEGFEPTDLRKTLRLATLAGCDLRALVRSRCSLTRTLQERILSPPRLRVATENRWRVVARESRSESGLPASRGWTPTMRFTAHSRSPFRIRGALFVRASPCEGRDLNPRTSTGADLESAAVSGLGYPRTQFGITPSWDLSHRFRSGGGRFAGDRRLVRRTGRIAGSHPDTSKRGPPLQTHNGYRTADWPT